MQEGVDWTNLAHHRDQWWAFVKRVTTFRVEKERGKFFGSLRDYQLFKRGSAPWSFISR
jgi:hypothetical protein